MQTLLDALDAACLPRIITLVSTTDGDNDENDNSKATTQRETFTNI